MPDPATQSDPAPDLRRISTADGSYRVQLSGAWNLQALEHRLAELAPRLAEYAAERTLQWDLRGVDVMDHAGAMLLWRAWGRQRAANLVLKPEHEPVFNHLDLPSPPVLPVPPYDPLWLVVMIGHKVLTVLDHLAAVVMVLGQVALDAVFLIRRPGSIPWREISSNIYRTGAQALGITALVGFLIGVVLSYL